MAKGNHNQLASCVMIALFVAGKVQGVPNAVPGTAGPDLVPERINGTPVETGKEDVVTTATGDGNSPVDTTTESTRTTTHDRVLFTDTPVMDAITIVWYLATFIALVSFFLVMACADRNRCGTRKPATEELQPPPTPAPSYRLFAPPSYDTLEFEKDNDSIYIIPYDTRIDSDQHQRNAEGLATNLEDIIEPPSLRRQPSSHSVRISDISEEGDDVPTVIIAVRSVSVRSSDATDEQDVTAL
ncbi:uncharacterized protein LOC128714275 [Anopheles marshallii]|uniref:uncharacterized protein LOC128714275 n=1 Tax=Anopheles marshallii TaxID=1521116 RepID=UPI00237C3626|nr:uncharacterized protein LOC128714275 [Anopheles marshallii]